MAMNDEQFARFLYEVNQYVMSQRKDSDYVVNKPQMDKYMKMLKFFLDNIKKYGGSVDPEDFSPKQQCGGMTASFTVFCVSGDEVARFCEVMSYASAITIDASNVGIDISITIPDIFIKKD